jgi:hAT family C-terminal dimerisation region
MYPTRWCVRSTAINAFIKNYEVTLATFDQLSSDKSVRSESRSKIDVVLKSLARVETYLGLLICSSLFGPCEELARLLQSKSMNLSSATTGARILCGTLSKMRCDENFAAIYKKAELAMEQLQLKPPKLESVHRRRRTPARFELTSNPSAAHEFSTHAERIRMQYFEALDILITAVEERFNQPGIEQLLKVEELIMLSANDNNNEALLKTVLEIYGQDFERNGSRLKAQLIMLPQLIQDTKLKVDDITRKEATKTVSGLVVFLQSVPPASLNLFGEVLKLIRLLLVCPASAASAERSFSGLRRLKTWLRSSISQERLTHLAILHAHQLYVDEHAAEVLRVVSQEFISKTEERESTFGPPGSY